MTLLSASALARQAPQSASTVRLANALLQRPPPAKYMFVGFHIYLCISQEPRRVPAPCVLLAVGKYGPVGSTSSAAATYTSCPFPSSLQLRAPPQPPPAPTAAMASSRRATSATTATPRPRMDAAQVVRLKKAPPAGASALLPWKKPNVARRAILAATAKDART